MESTAMTSKYGRTARFAQNGPCEAPDTVTHHSSRLAACNQHDLRYQP